MAIPKKGSQVTNHYDTQYRWIVRSTGRFSELHVELNAVIDGQRLVVEAPKVFHLDVILDAIDFANANGWRKEEKHPEYRIRFTRKGFILLTDGQT